MRQKLSAAARRDAVLNAIKAREQTWFTRAFVLAAERLKHRKGKEMTGEDIRLLIDDGAQELPGDAYRNPGPHVWGALVRELMRDGFIVPTRNWIPMRTPRSHARLTRVYRVA